MRIDAQARIHVYIHLAPFGEEQLAALRASEVEIELASESLAVVQGWVPFDRIDPVASFDFVRRMTTPKYGTRRQGSVTTDGDAIIIGNAVLDFSGAVSRTGAWAGDDSHYAAFLDAGKSVVAGVASTTDGDGATMMARVVNGTHGGAESPGMLVAVKSVPSLPDLVQPLGAELLDTTTTFTWRDDGTHSDAWRLQVGSSEGGGEVFSDYVDGGSQAVAGLPTDGSSIYATLYYQIAGVWASVSAQYTASGP